MPRLDRPPARRDVDAFYSISTANHGRYDVLRIRAESDSYMTVVEDSRQFGVATSMFRQSTLATDLVNLAGDVDTALNRAADPLDANSRQRGHWRSLGQVAVWWQLVRVVPG
jgi:hypothetical protein